MEFVGLTHDHAFDLSLTQTDLGDATGLSVVHVNRTIGRLRDDGLIHISSTAARIGVYVLYRELLIAQIA